jgi:predicted DNA-binding protein
MSEEIDNRSDILDVRDIIERFEELEEHRIATKAVERYWDGYKWTGSTEEYNEYIKLEKLLDELKGNGGDEQWKGDWYPITLIHRDYFEDYARELAEDIGAIDPNAGWPLQHIDWEAAANELEQDYSNVYFDGEEYLYR